MIGSASNKHKKRQRGFALTLARLERKAGPPLRTSPNPVRLRIASDRFLEFLGDAEGDFLARLDLDRFAGRGIASHASSALAHLQDAKPIQTDAGALLEGLRDKSGQIIHDLVSLLLVQPM